MIFVKLVLVNFIVAVIILFTSHSKAGDFSFLAEAVNFAAHSESFSCVRTR